MTEFVKSSSPESQADGIVIPRLGLLSPQQSQLVRTGKGWMLPGAAAGGEQQAVASQWRSPCQPPR